MKTKKFHDGKDTAVKKYNLHLDGKAEASRFMNIHKLAQVWMIPPTSK